MTDKQPTLQDVYAQIKANPGAYAKLMNLPDHDTLVARLVQICQDAGLADMTTADMTTADMTRFFDRDPGEILQDLNGEDGLSDEELELVAAAGGNQRNVAK